MVIVDTSVWVDHLRSGSDPLETLLLDGKVITHEFIIGELACGNLRNRVEILSLLSALPASPTVDQSEFLHFIDEQRIMGCGIGFVDAHLLASAQLFGWPIWTEDKKVDAVAKDLGLRFLGK